MTEARRRRALAALGDEGLDALVVTNLTNIRYLTGFRGSTGFLLLADRSTLLVDERYREAAVAEAPGVEIVSVPSSQLLPGALAELVAHAGRARIGFEASTMPVAQHARLARGPVQLVATEHLIERCRMVKDAGEIALLRSAAELAAALLETAWAAAAPGRTELEVAAEIDRVQRVVGEESSANLIVAAGERTSLPHAAPSTRLIERDEPVLVDVAPSLHGYRGDLTRLAFTGAVPTGYRELFDAVRGAQEAAFTSIRPGMTARDLDELVRGWIRRAGHGDLFVHASGHGIGLAIHEPPILSAYGDIVIEPGMVIMIEPGLYLPGRYGVRLEDAVLITETGCELLATAPSEIRVLG